MTERIGDYVIRRPATRQWINGWTVARAADDTPLDWFVFKRSARRAIARDNFR